MEPMTVRAERVLLESMLQEPGIRDIVAPYLDAEDFLAGQHREMFGAIRRADPSGDVPWPHAVLTAARAPHLIWRYVNELLHACPDQKHGLDYARRLVEVGAEDALQPGRSHPPQTGDLGRWLPSA